jgi:segregation and condensation protein A
MEREEVSTAQFARGESAGSAQVEAGTVPLDVDLYGLIEALQRVLRRAADRKERLVFAPEVSLAARINDVLELLEKHGSLLFHEIFDGQATRLHIVVTFLAVLELAKQKVVRLFQEAPLQPFRIVLAT